MERLSSSHSGPVADPGFLSRLGSKCVGIAEHIIVPEVCQIFHIMPTYDQMSKLLGQSMKSLQCLFLVCIKKEIVSGLGGSRNCWVGYPLAVMGGGNLF